MQETLDALEHGQADILRLANAISLDKSNAASLCAGPRIRVPRLKANLVLQAMGGVGALLRSRFK